MSTKLKVIDSLEGFHALKEQWNLLYLESDEATIFSSWDWMYTWWEVFHESLSSQLFILSLYENEKLIGLAPFHIVVDSFPRSIIQGKTIRFIGCGENKKDQIVSQYMDFLVSPANKEKMIDLISEFLISSKDKWDFADFPFLLEKSIVSKCFTREKVSINLNYTEYGYRFYIPEMDNFGSFLNKLGNRWSKMYEKKTRKLQNQGDVKIESSDDVDSAKKAFHQLSEMHQARWENRTELNIFTSKLFNEFHLKVLERLVPQDKAFIKHLSLDQKPLSSYYYFVDKSQIHYYQSGFYTENANKYSPLFLLVCKEIGKAIKSKFTFDFMFDENSSSYKKEQYAAVSEPMYRLMWSTNKTRMMKHNSAKVLQSVYLNVRSSLFQSEK